MIVALLTDFGTRDHYVGTMKGVVLSVCPEATLVDITHEIGPQDVLAAALELGAAFRYFPPATVFLCVVDPGVGSSRRGIAVDAEGYRFVAPDNGVLTPAFGASPRIVELSDRRFARSTVSRTFEGRDRFAPAAGWLARGTELREFGPEVSDPVRLVVPVPRVTAAGVEGEVLRVDRFGNLITNIDARTLGILRHPIVSIAGRQIARMVSTYAEAAPGELCALLSSTGHVEIAINGGSAADTLAVGRSAGVVLTSGA